MMTRDQPLCGMGQTPAWSLLLTRLGLDSSSVPHSLCDPTQFSEPFCASLSAPEARGHRLFGGLALLGHDSGCQQSPNHTPPRTQAAEAGTRELHGGVCLQRAWEVVRVGKCHRRLPASVSPLVKGRR